MTEPAQSVISPGDSLPYFIPLGVDGEIALPTSHSEPSVPLSWH